MLSSIKLASFSTLCLSRWINLSSKYGFGSQLKYINWKGFSSICLRLDCLNKANSYRFPWLVQFLFVHAQNLRRFPFFVLLQERHQFLLDKAGPFSKLALKVNALTAARQLQILFERDVPRILARMLAQFLLSSTIVQIPRIYVLYQKKEKAVVALHTRHFFQQPLLHAPSIFFLHSFILLFYLFIDLEADQIVVFKCVERFFLSVFKTELADNLISSFYFLLEYFFTFVEDVVFVCNYLLESLV